MTETSTAGCSVVYCTRKYCTALRCGRTNTKGGVTGSALSSVYPTIQAPNSKIKAQINQN